MPWETYYNTVRLLCHATIKSISRDGENPPTLYLRSIIVRRRLSGTRIWNHAGVGRRTTLANQHSCNDDDSRSPFGVRDLASLHVHVQGEINRWADSSRSVLEAMIVLHRVWRRPLWGYRSSICTITDVSRADKRVRCSSLSATLRNGGLRALAQEALVPTWNATDHCFCPSVMPSSRAEDHMPYTII